MLRMPAAPRRSTGNATLLVLVDSSQAEYAHLPETLFAALRHFGMPYRLFDLARAQLEADLLLGHAAAVVAQEHLTPRLSLSDVKELLAAVEAGVGLVNFDHDLLARPDPLCEVLGLAAHPAGGPRTGGAEELIVADSEHFITYTQEVGLAHRFKMPVPVTLSGVSHPRARVLAETTVGAPLLMATRHGRGRIVQWLASPKLWTRAYFGHARGLDDLFWKSLVWVAQKPFVMLAMPPFVRLRFDDCRGLWRHAADFNFVDVLNGFGHIPTLCLCMRAVTDDGARKINQLSQDGRAEFAPHTLEPGTGIFYGDERGPYSAEDLRGILEEVDGLFARWGVRPSTILSDHDHEYSSAALPLLKDRGICFKMNITLPDERWGDVHVDWRPAPYGSMNYAFDYLPGTCDLFVVFNHFPAFEYARAYLPDGRFLYNRAGGFGPYMWDFLNGLTASRKEREANDIEAAARRLAAHTRLGLDSLFFGGSITHSHFARDLSESEWRALLERYEALTARYQKLHVSYEHIAEYARSKVNTHLEHVERDAPSGTVRCVLVGETTVALQLYVFTDEGEGVAQRFEAVPAFRGRTDAVLSGG